MEEVESDHPKLHREPLGDSLVRVNSKDLKAQVGDLPPPRGVLGCGASTIAMPGV
jgi:hypothetical protein